MGDKCPAETSGDLFGVSTEEPLDGTENWNQGLLLPVRSLFLILKLGSSYHKEGGDIGADDAEEE